MKTLLFGMYRMILFDRELVVQDSSNNLWMYLQNGVQDC
jgi:hypothetical protein